MTFMQDILHAFWSYLLEASPWLLIGLAVAGTMHAFVPQHIMQRWLGEGRKWAVVRAAAIGIPLPLCSCSVIPTASALRAGGASRGSSAAFAISTPEVDAPSIALTWGLIGPWVAIARPIAALATALGVGWLIDRFVSDRTRPAELTESSCAPAETSCCASSAPSCCCDDDVAKEYTPEAHPLARAAQFALITLPRNLAMWILIGLALSAVVAAIVPPDWFSQIASVDQTGLLTKFAALVIGIPWYVCATASTPLAAALIAAGLSPGAGLVFLLAGPATNPATMGWVFKDLGARALAIYLAGIAIGALLAGVVLDLLPAGAVNMVDDAVQHAHDTPLRIAMAIALLVILLPGAFGALVAHLKRMSPKRDTPAQSCCH